MVADNSPSFFGDDHNPLNVPEQGSEIELVVGK